jgi:quinolinate synthase
MKETINSIKALKKEKDAVILAHYYVAAEVQKIADYVGDSYYLSKIANETPQKVILFCGVSFMGESAKILNPEKTIIMPDASADCPMAHMIQMNDILLKRAEYEDLAVVCYINSTAETKAVSDVCVTSSNAIAIVKALPQKNIYFVPDKNLGTYLSTLLPEKNFIFNEGFCYVHNEIEVGDVEAVLANHPNAKVLVHPECHMAVIKMADYVGSTAGIIDFATKNEGLEFIICTEEGIKYKLEQANPNKSFYFPAPIPLCKDMKKITLKKIEDALKTLDKKIELNEDLRIKAEKALKRMHEIAGQSERI